jgi:hypothetical protein
VVPVVDVIVVGRLVAVPAVVGVVEVIVVG